MTTKIICMASAKGGSGKTMLTATFAAFLTQLGKKVLLIDMDAATNGLTLLYIKEVLMQGEIILSSKVSPLGIYESMTKGDGVDIVKLASGIDLIPAAFGFINTDSRQITEDYLYLILNDLKEKYDFIFLDAQSGSDNHAYLCMKRNIADEVVIVSEYDPMSAAGVERLKGLFREDLTYERTWVLLNKMLPEFVQSFSDFLEVAKYLSPVPWDAEVVRAYARRKIALNLENGNEHTYAIMQTLRSLFSDSIKDDIDKFSNNWAESLRIPLLEKVNEYRNKLEILTTKKDKLLEEYDIRLKSKKAYPVSIHSSTQPFVYAVFIVFALSLLALFSVLDIVSFDWNNVYLFSSLALIVSIFVNYFGKITKADDRQMELFHETIANEIHLINSEIENSQKQLNEIEAMNNAELLELLRKKMQN